MNDEAREGDPQLDLDSISQLIPKSKAGDAAAAEALLTQMQDYLTLMANRHMDKKLQQKLGVSDIVQQSMTQVVQNFDGFRGSTVAEFRGWLKTIVINELNKTRRSYRYQKRDIAREPQLDPGTSTIGHGLAPADLNPTPASEAIAGERIANFHKALDKLPEDYAEVIRLRSIEKLSFSEVAERMGRTRDSVSNLWYRALLKLEKELRDSGNFSSDVI